jgi:hypothetical protein
MLAVYVRNCMLDRSFEYVRRVVDIYVGTMSTTLALWAKRMRWAWRARDGVRGLSIVLAGYQTK